MKVIDIVSTPNPNAVKVLLDGTVAAGTKSYFNRAAATDDGLALRLFDVPGVVGVMMLGTFVTISKEKEAAWGEIIERVKGVLEGA